MENMLSQLIGTQLFAALMIFARVGTAFVWMPGVGESFVSPRVRLLFALMVSVLLTPVLGSHIPPIPSQVMMLFAYIAGEIFYGFFLGMMARFLMVVIEVTGMIIAMQLSLANASVFNPAMASQSSLVGALLGVMSITLFFATDLHHLLLLAVADSYTIFLPATLPNFQDFSAAYSSLLADGFQIAVQLAAPFIILGLVFYLGLGLLARLMPQLQIFFIAIPVQIYFGLMLLGLVLSATMMVWLRYAQATLNTFLDIG